MNISKEIVQFAKQKKYDNIAIIDTSDITFESELRAFCESNACGKYGTSWCCPPGCGDAETLKKKILGYKKGMVVQKIYPLEDSFDLEGMRDASYKFNELFYGMDDFINNSYKEDHYSLKASSCKLCDKCRYPDQECKNPEKARPSVEACCINVILLCQSCGIPYMNGKNTVSYVALFLF